MQKADIWQNGIQNVYLSRIFLLSAKKKYSVKLLTCFEERLQKINIRAIDKLMALIYFRLCL